MRRRRIKPVKEAEEHAINAIDKTYALEARYISNYKGEFKDNVYKFFGNV